jgi:hypothetical protein
MVFLLGLFQLTFADDERPLDTVDWETFSENLVNAFVVGNDGVKVSAMQNIITYSNYLDVQDAAFDVVRIYRNHPNQKVRQMAAVTITKLNNKWAEYFLKSNTKFEDNPMIKRQILNYFKQTQRQALNSAESDVAGLISELTQ